MLMLLMVVVVLFAIAVVTTERREAQYKAVIVSLKEARTVDANVIAGLQQQVAELLEDKADLNADIKRKDSQIAGLVSEVAARQATVEKAFEEAWSLRQKAEELAKKNLSLKKDRDKACEIADQLYRQ